MRVLVQRVDWARVWVEGKTVAEIGKGLLILLGVSHHDSDAEASKLAQKCSKLRIFNDTEGKMNLSVKDIQGAVLVVSQFTLYADARKGNRPSYIDAALPEPANRLYQVFSAALQQEGLELATGVFGANMDVELLNQGPVTIWLDSASL
jgi:D-tyrosyl-tRNA(Tyr) deacylase